MDAQSELQLQSLTRDFHYIERAGYRIAMEETTVAQWLAHAEESRQRAATMSDVGARQTVLMIATFYEKMAHHAALVADLLESKTADG